MLEITARDVIGTARSNATYATHYMDKCLSESATSGDLSAIENLLIKALADVSLARHQMSPDWADTIYVGRWDNA